MSARPRAGFPHIQSPSDINPGGSPEVAFVGGVFDVVADIIEHPMGCGAVPGIEHLKEWK